MVPQHIPLQEHHRPADEEEAGDDDELLHDGDLRVLGGVVVLVSAARLRENLVDVREDPAVCDRQADVGGEDDDYTQGAVQVVGEDTEAAPGNCLASGLG